MNQTKGKSPNALNWKTRNSIEQNLREQTANIHWIIEKPREFQKYIYICFIDYAKAFDCVDHNKLENSSRDGNTRPPDLTSWEICRQIKKQVRNEHGANQNHDEVPLHANQDGCYPKVYKQ